MIQYELYYIKVITVKNLKALQIVKKFEKSVIKWITQQRATFSSIKELL